MLVKKLSSLAAVTLFAVVNFNIGVKFTSRYNYNQIFIENVTEANLPNISFYLYPFEDFPLTRGPNTTCDYTKLNVKHSTAYFAIESMIHHPWRTRNPWLADIAIIPTALDLWSREGCQNISRQDLENELRKAISNSSIFPIKRHLIIANDFKSKGIARVFMKILDHTGIQVGMEGRGDCRTSAMYTSRYAMYESLIRPNAPAPPSKRKYSINMVGKFDNRPAYRERLELFRRTAQPFPSSPFITTRNKEHHYKEIRLCENRNDTDRCISNGWPDSGTTQKAQENSNYTLALRGDTLGSDRWINGMAAGSAIIQVASDNFLEKRSNIAQKALSWLPYPCAIPWEDFVLTIPRSKFLKNPSKALSSLLSSISEERLLNLQLLSFHYTNDVDWDASRHRVLENLLRESYFQPCKKFEIQQQQPRLKPLLEQDWCVANQAVARKRALLAIDDSRKL